jgi:hypothetical protein
MELSGHRNTRDRHQEQLDELKSRQDNIVWPGFVSNARRIDEVLFQGADHAPLVQRFGAWLLGLAAVLVGLSLVSLGAKASYIVVALGLGFVMLGAFWIIRGCRGLGASKKADSRKRTH